MNDVAAAARPRRRGRPPKGAESTYPSTRDAMIRAGLALLTEKGYSSVGLDEILRPIEVPKGSFYHFFDSKEAFGRELIDAYADYFARKLDRFFLNSDRPALTKLADFAADAKRGMARHAFRRGCLVGNLGQEMGTLPESFRQRLIDVFKDWERRTANCLRDAQQEGAISRSLNCDELATHFWIGWEGAVLRAKLEQNPQALDLFFQGFLRTIQSHRQS